MHFACSNEVESLSYAALSCYVKCLAHGGVAYVWRNFRSGSLNFPHRLRHLLTKIGRESLGCVAPPPPSKASKTRPIYWALLLSVDKSPKSLKQSSISCRNPHSNIPCSLLRHSFSNHFLPRIVVSYTNISVFVCTDFSHFGVLN